MKGVQIFFNQHVVKVFGEYFDVRNGFLSGKTVALMKLLIWEEKRRESMHWEPGKLC